MVQGSEANIPEEEFKNTTEDSFNYKVEDRFFFNLIPITEENIAEWQILYFSLDQKAVFNKGGYSIFGDILSKIGQNPTINTYAFVASAQAFTDGDKISEIVPEMMMAVSIDTKGHLSQHLGIQRYIVDFPHSRIAIQVHSFCAAATKKLYPETTHMTSNPLKIMRDALISALGKDKILFVEERTWDETEFRSLDGKKIEITKPLPEILSITFPGNSPDRLTPQTFIELDDLAGLCPEFNMDYLT